MSDPDPLKGHIQKTVGVSALKKIRHIVDEYEEQEKAERRFSKWLWIGVVAFFVVVALFPLTRTAEQSRAFVAQISPPVAGARRLDVGGGKLHDRDLNRYVAEWGEKVQRQLSEGLKTAPANRGQCMLTVAIRSDGALERIEVQESTGDRNVDKSVAEIIKQAAPFAPFPPTVKAQIDVLHITRVFEFAGRQ